MSETQMPKKQPLFEYWKEMRFSDAHLGLGNILHENHNEEINALVKQRDQWRECAERLAEALWQESSSLEIPSVKHSALMKFEKLKQSDKWSESVIKTASNL